MLTMLSVVKTRLSELRGVGALEFASVKQCVGLEVGTLRF
jgi:hypothetical protein